MILRTNNTSTTILHQAISAKNDMRGRTAVILQVLELAPVAASIPNGLNYLPIHTLLQRNTSMDSQTRGNLVAALIKADPQSLLKRGGKQCRRTALHIAFAAAEYLSLELLRSMVGLRPRACFMRDGKGLLPIHIACGNHCSPQKIQILLDANPSALFATTPDGQTPLSLASSKVTTKKHSNKRLIKKLSTMMTTWQGDRDVELEIKTQVIRGRNRVKVADPFDAKSTSVLPLQTIDCNKVREQGPGVTSNGKSQRPLVHPSSHREEQTTQTKNDPLLQLYLAALQVERDQVPKPATEAVSQQESTLVPHPKHGLLHQLYQACLVVERNGSDEQTEAYASRKEEVTPTKNDPLLELYHATLLVESGQVPNCAFKAIGHGDSQQQVVQHSSE